jgi:hypothetical protein
MMMMMMMMMMAIQSPHTTRRNIPEDSSLQGDHHENVKYHKFPLPYIDQ